MHYRRSRWQALSFCAALIAWGCATRIPPPVLGSTVSSTTACEHIAVGEGAVWIVMLTEEMEYYLRYHLARIDPETDQIVAVVPLSGVTGSVTDLAAGLGAVWVARQGSTGTIQRIDPLTNRAGPEINVGSGWLLGSTKDPFIALGEGAVWVAISSHDQLFRLDAETGQVIQAIRLSEDALFEKAPLIVGEGAVWVGTEEGISRVDPRTNSEVASIPVDWEGWQPLVDLVVGASAVWVSEMGGSLNRIDPQTNEVVAVAMPVSEWEKVFGGSRETDWFCVDGHVRRVPSLP